MSRLHSIIIPNFVSIPYHDLPLSLGIFACLRSFVVDCLALHPLESPIICLHVILHVLYLLYTYLHLLLP